MDLEVLYLSKQLGPSVQVRLLGQQVRSVKMLDRETESIVRYGVIVNNNNAILFCR
jgi:hypothetical protein